MYDSSAAARLDPDGVYVDPADAMHDSALVAAAMHDPALGGTEPGYATVAGVGGGRQTRPATSPRPGGPHARTMGCSRVGAAQAFDRARAAVSVVFAPRSPEPAPPQHGKGEGEGEYAEAAAAVAAAPPSGPAVPVPHSGGSISDGPRRSMDPGDGHGHVYEELPFLPSLDREGRAAMQAAKAKLVAGIVTQAEFDRIQSVNAYIAQLADDTAFS